MVFGAQILQVKQLKKIILNCTPSFCAQLSRPDINFKVHWQNILKQMSSPADMLLWKNKTCPANTWLNTSYDAVIILWVTLDSLLPGVLKELQYMHGDAVGDISNVNYVLF